MTVKQVAERLEVSPGMVYALVAAGKLRCYRIGRGKGVLRFDDRQVAEYLSGAETRAIEVPPPRLNLKHLSL